MGAWDKNIASVMEDNTCMTFWDDKIKLAYMSITYMYSPANNIKWAYVASDWIPLWCY